MGYRANTKSEPKPLVTPNGKLISAGFDKLKSPTAREREDLSANRSARRFYFFKRRLEVVAEKDDQRASGLRMGNDIRFEEPAIEALIRKSRVLWSVVNERPIKRGFKERLRC